MMALQILPIIQVIVILSFPSIYAYPAVYGTKRFGGNGNSDWSNQMYRQPGQQHPQMIRSQRYPSPSYYDMYPEDRYYPQDPMSYPLYYPRTSKYEVYQAVLPYYYADRQPMRPAPIDYSGYYGYDDSATRAADPMLNLEEEMHESEIEQREDAQPIGHETYYENDDDNMSEDSMDEINAAFLQNLIMSQMYRDNAAAASYGSHYGEKYYGSDGYDSDEDVKELKELAARPATKKPKHEQLLDYYQPKQAKNKQHKLDRHESGSNGYSNSNNWNEKRSMIMASEKTSTTGDQRRRPASSETVFGKASFVVNDGSTKSPLQLSTERPTAASSTFSARRDTRGQKEEVLLRPATPVRRPFSQPIMDMLSKNNVERKRAPSVYDTIKHMLEIEEKLDKNNFNNDIKPAMRKRIISSEDSLTKQLSILKKDQ